MNLDTYHDNLVEYQIATEEEIKLVTLINGWNKESLDSILYARTGYRSWDQYEGYIDGHKDGLTSGWLEYMEATRGEE